ncbi:hypothetical protein CLAIMM_12219 isoform 2 [Cladophialophora immunda]|nr:hypothetical protein CLAIMM_12219 isoform 2 [Cladophialophora immunda]
MAGQGQGHGHGVTVTVTVTTLILGLALLDRMQLSMSFLVPEAEMGPLEKLDPFPPIFPPPLLQPSPESKQGNRGQEGWTMISAAPGPSRPPEVKVNRAAETPVTAASCRTMEMNDGGEVHWAPSYPGWFASCVVRRCAATTTTTTAAARSRSLEMEMDLAGGWRSAPQYHYSVHCSGTCLPLRPVCHD